MEKTKILNALAALAQESRLAVFRALVQAGPAGLAAGKISELTGIAPSSLSFHLKELLHANLVDSPLSRTFHHLHSSILDDEPTTRLFN